MEEVKFPEIVAEMARHGERYGELAKKIGMSYNSLWRRLAGKTEWTIDEINKVCEIYGKSYEELFK